MFTSQSMGFQEHTVQYASTLSPGERVHNLRFPSRLREEGKLLKAAANDRFSVQTQPLLQQRGIGATEVVVIVQVAFEQLLRCQGWVFPIQPALNRIADDKGDAAGAVVGPRTVVMHAPAKLREQKDHDVRAGVVLLQVLIERADSI